MRLFLAFVLALLSMSSTTALARPVEGVPCARAGATYARDELQGHNGVLLYAQQRWLDPSVGRFLSLDPVQGSLSEPLSTQGFTYADGKPTRFTDRDGRDAGPAEADVRDAAVIEDAKMGCQFRIGALCKAVHKPLDPEIVRRRAADFEKDSRFVVEQGVRAGDLAKQPGSLLAAVPMLNQAAGGRVRSLDEIEAIVIAGNAIGSAVAPAGGPIGGPQNPEVAALPEVLPGTVFRHGPSRVACSNETRCGYVAEAIARSISDQERSDGFAD